MLQKFREFNLKIKESISAFIFLAIISLFGFFIPALVENVNSIMKERKNCSKKEFLINLENKQITIVKVSCKNNEVIYGIKSE